jgi:hypothetical protein
MSIIAAVLLTDRKPVFPVALEYLCYEPLIEKLYVNIQTDNFEIHNKALEYLGASGKPFDTDFWNFNSSWMGKPQYDQDPLRFNPISTGRNFALDWAINASLLNQSVSHLLFVDSDVRPHKGGLEHLLALGKPLAGGYVPGRGAHSHVKYVFGNPVHTGNIIKCEHGTSGYLLIERKLFEIQRFRSGPSLVNGTSLCDDPNYAADAVFLGRADGWYIDVRATADHVDDPERPLTLEGAINDYHKP